MVLFFIILIVATVLINNAVPPHACRGLSLLLGQEMLHGWGPCREGLDGTPTVGGVHQPFGQ